MDPIVSTFLVILFVIVATKLLFSTGGKKKKPNLPPSPPSLPIIGHLHLIKNQLLHRALEKISREHGPVLLLRFGFRRVLVVTTPSVAEECLTTHDVVFANRPRLLAGKYFGYNYSDIGWAPHGPLWKELRRLATHDVLSSRTVNHFSFVREEELYVVLRRLHQDLKGECKKINLKPRLFPMSLNIIMRMMTGKRYHGDEAEKGDETAKQLQTIVPDLLRLSGESNVGDFFPILRWFGPQSVEREQKALSKKIHKLMDDMIEDLKKRRSSPDAGAARKSDSLEGTHLDAMLKLQDQNSEYYTNVTIMGQIMGLIVAGTDTSKVTIEWAICLLLNNPEKMSKAIAELQEKIGPNRLVKDADLPNLPYLQAIICETLRYRPPSPLFLPHESSADTIVAGYHVTRGTMLLVNSWAMLRDETLWDEPEKFLPERFLNPDAARTAGYKYLPFGAGRRKCPGEPLAVKVVGLSLANLLHCFEWERIGGEIDLTEGVGLSMLKAVPLEAMCRTKKGMGSLFT